MLLCAAIVADAGFGRLCTAADVPTTQANDFHKFPSMFYSCSRSFISILYSSFSFLLIYGSAVIDFTEFDFQLFGYLFVQHPHPPLFSPIILLPPLYLQTSCFKFVNPIPAPRLLSPYQSGTQSGTRSSLDQHKHNTSASTPPHVGRGYTSKWGCQLH